MKNFKSASSGFTLIEIAAVLVIMAVMAVVATEFAMDTKEVDLIVQAEKIKAHVRYAQARAMSSDKVYGVKFDGGSYWLFKDGDETSRVALPGEQGPIASLPAGQSAGTAIVAFDSWGRPCTDAAGATPQVGDRTVSVGSQNIVIVQNTGFIP